MRFFRKGLVGLFLLTLSIGILAYAGYTVSSAVKDRISKKPRIPQKKERVFTVNVVSSAPETIVPFLSAFGEIQSRRSLDLRMATSGQVIKLSENFVEGGQVKSGEILVQLSKADALSALQKAETDLIDAKTEVLEAERAIDLVKDELKSANDQADLRTQALTRQIDLKNRGVGTAAAVEVAELAASSANQAILAKRSSFDRAKARQAQAQTRLARVQLAVSDAKRFLKETTLIAEFDGVLSDITLVKGGLVSPNERLGRLIDPMALEVAFRISTEQYARLLNDNGDLFKGKAELSMGANFTADAELSRDSGSVAAGQSGRLVFAKILEPRGLKPGDFVSLKVSEPPVKYVMRVPASSINSQDEVLIVDGENRLKRIKVEVLRIQGDDILIRSRDAAGQAIVAEQTQVLGPGIKVKTVKAGEVVESEEPSFVELSSERRAKLIAFIEGNGYIPAEVKTKIIGQLEQEKVPAEVVDRIESRMGG